MRFLVLVFALATVAPSLAQTAPDTTALHEATRLGRLLYAYDQAAWHATDAVMVEVQGDVARLAAGASGSAVEPDGSGWRVSYGRLSADSTEALVAYHVRLDSAFTATGTEAFEPPVARTGFVRDALIAQSAVQFTPSMPTPPGFRYNSATLPGPDGTVYVYFYPAQTESDVHYVGADTRYTVDLQQRRVTARADLHPHLGLFDLRDNEAMTMTTHVSASGLPTETDVFYAMVRRPFTAGVGAHTILTPDWAFVLDPTGAVSWEPVGAFRSRMRVTVNGR